VGTSAAHEQTLVVDAQADVSEDPVSEATVR
jgi:hypothetical protein